MNTMSSYRDNHVEEGTTYQNNNAYGSVPTVNHDDETEQLLTASKPFSWNAKALAMAGLALTALVGMSSLYNHNNSSAQDMTTMNNVELWGSSHKKKNHKHSKKEEEPKITQEFQVPHYYHDQLVDHFDPTNDNKWTNRYYVSSKYWQGAGKPLFVVMGGEDAVDEILYPFVVENLAAEFGAYVMQTEHRYYGTSMPTPNTNENFRLYFTPDQALADFARLIRFVQADIGCSTDRSSPDYCPVITVGASYPGFLSAMMRFVYPDVVDMSYASSAPLKLYAQSGPPDIYFDWVTKVAEGASKGCAEAYKSSLEEIHADISSMPIDEAAKKLGICPDIPDYINTPELFADELTMMVGFSNADFNMDYHPPGDPHTDVIKACKAFQQKHKSAMHRMADYMVVKAESGATNHPGEPCYDLHWDIPSGPNARITGADWSGMGDGDTARTWEYQCCSDLIINTPFGPNSMFLERPFDLDWLTGHCQRRFGVTPRPTRMVDNWHFDDLVGHNASYILFTNGLKDGWSPLSYTEDLSDTIVALNFPSGAHHSDLNTCCKDRPEEEDIIQGRKDIIKILGKWIKDVKSMSS